MTNLVYGLVDPRTLLVRYVGLSATGLKRACAHRLPSALAGAFAARAGHSPETIAKIRASNLGQKRPSSVGLAVAESNRRRVKERLK